MSSPLCDSSRPRSESDWYSRVTEKHSHRARAPYLLSHQLIFLATPSPRFRLPTPLCILLMTVSCYHKNISWKDTPRLSFSLEIKNDRRRRRRDAFSRVPFCVTALFMLRTVYIALFAINAVRRFAGRPRATLIFMSPRLKLFSTSSQVLVFFFTKVRRFCLTTSKRKK